MVRLKQYIYDLGLSIPLEILKFSLINIFFISIGILIYIFHIGLYLLLLVFGFMFLVDYLFISRYQNLTFKAKKEKDNDFVSLLSYLKILIYSKITVYQAFTMLIPYTSKSMSIELDNFIKEIDNDKSVKPFINLSSKFSLPLIENILITLYQMVDQGDNPLFMNQFDNLLYELDRSTRETLIDNQKKGLNMVNAFPLIGAGIITIIMTFSIIGLLAEGSLYVF